MALVVRQSAFICGIVLACGFCCPLAVATETGPQPVADSLPLVESADEPAIEDEEPWSFFNRCGQEECRRTKVRGWLAQGFTWNPDNPRDRSNGPQGMNDRANDYQLSQLGLSMQRELLADKQDWDIGWQMDVLFGSDARFVQSQGFDDEWITGTYAAWSIPQLFAEVLLPGERGCSLKLGRFWTPLGYDGIPAADRFFYSVTNTYMFAEPSTHWGAMATVPLSEQWTAQTGIVNGWDVTNDNNDSAAFLGTLGWVSEDEGTTATGVLYLGDNSDTLNDNQVSYSLMVTHKCTERVTFLFWHDLGCAQRIATAPSGGAKNAQWYGVNNYLLYAINEQVSLGARFEWFRDDDGVLLQTAKSDTLLGPGDLFSLTCGVNYAPSLNWILRPEVRYDWANRVTPFVDESQKHQWTIAADLITRF